VFETHDAGATWHDVSGDLVDAPANDVVLAGDHLVVGTDVGVFVAGLHGGTWLRVGAGLPNTVVNDLDVTPNGDLVIAATHGRGLWSIPTAELG
jgi:ligand-binding sensor domain-containing protein